MNKKIHMICNAHIDPVWQWEWDEGAAAAISTFRAAADFCENYDGLIFNHNEAILYGWIEEYEPKLFKRIQKLVEEGKWHIMGGWYLQPDCIMPSGESFVRQILLGKEYFKEKFNVIPSTAVNFDSFGHTRGLVQILAKSGYDSYIFMRPDKEDYEIKRGVDFVWKGFDGSEIVCHKIMPGYNSLLGRVQEKIGTTLAHFKGQPIGLMPWGVGNHGGGPSRQDLGIIKEFQSQEHEFEFEHSCPEKYFEDLKELKIDLPIVEKSLTPIFVGCYTSQIRVKKKHRELENMLYMVEKMAVQAEINGVMEYPKEKLKQASKYLAMAQFHDILPGTSIQTAEEYALNIMGGALNLLSEIRTKAFFALCSGQPKALEGEYPVLVYNPHPYPVKGIFECEFMLADQNWSDKFSVPVIYQDGLRCSSQIEKESSTINLDWRKRVVFEAELAPSSMNRFDCRIEYENGRPLYKLQNQNETLVFNNREMSVAINRNTGLIDDFSVAGKSLLKKSAFQPLVISDISDSWRMDTNSFTKVEGIFELMTMQEGAQFCGIENSGNMRVIEDGQVRTVVEAYFKYKSSSLCMTYKIPKVGTNFQVDVRVYWNEKDKMLKLCVPTTLEESKYIGQTAFGVETLQDDLTEVVSHKWVATLNDKFAVCVVNDGIYGSSFKNGQMNFSLLRSAGYCAHPIPDREIFPDDRFYPRQEQGERIFSFWLTGGDVSVLDRMDKTSTIHSEKPYTLSFFPSGDGETFAPAVVLNCKTVGVSALKKAENEDGYILRIYETCGKHCETFFEIEKLGIKHQVMLSPFEVKTFFIKQNCVTETNMMEDFI